MQVKNYISIAVLAKIEDEAEFELMRILAKIYNIELLQKGELFIRSPNEILL